MSLVYIDSVSVFFQLLHLFHTQDLGTVWSSHKDMGQSKCPFPEDPFKSDLYLKQLSSIKKGQHSCS